MKLTAEQRRIARAILEHPDDSFVMLVRIAGLDPGTALIGADLRGIVCTDDVTGFLFQNADLRGADFMHAQGKTAAMFTGAIVDLNTRGVPQLQPASPPPDLDPGSVTRLVLSGEAVPTAWIPFITELDLSFNRISNVDALAGLTSLQGLNLWGTQVSDITSLSGLSALRTLDLASTQVNDLTPLANLVALERLVLTSTEVINLSPLAGLHSLQSLVLMNTRVDDVTPLASLTALKSLNLMNTKVSDLTPLAGLAALQSLLLAGTRVNDLSPLDGSEQLTIFGAPEKIRPKYSR